MKYFLKNGNIKEKLFLLNKEIIRYNLDSNQIIYKIKDMNDFENVFNLLYIDDNEFIKNNFHFYLENIIELLKD